MVKKAPANSGADSAAQGDPVAPWTRGNNCLLSLKEKEKGTWNDSGLSQQQLQDEESGPLEVGSLSIKERKVVFYRLHENVE